MVKINELAGKNTVGKIQSTLINNPTCMLISSLNMINPSVCPMTVKTIEGNNAIWFLSHKLSEHYNNIKNNNNVLLTFVNNTDKEYLSISGQGFHFDTKEVIDALWDEQDVKWYENGKKDEHIVALKVVINDAYYWDTCEQKSILVE